MKTYAFIIFFFISTKLFAQTVEVVKESRDLNSRERYYVLKADSRIKEGKYIKRPFFRDDTICEGFYKNNLKDSLWINYSYHGHVADSGYYKQGKKVGVWKAYKLNGQLQVQYNFTSKQLEYYKPNPDDKTKMYPVVMGSSKTDTILDRPPIYLGGEAGVQAAIIHNITYPRKARENLIQGRVIIAFDIDVQGDTFGYYVKKPLGYDCDEEAMRAIKCIDEEWLPAMLNGKPVTVEYQVAVTFNFGN